MRVAAYSITSIEKGLLINENQNRHGISLISAPLGGDTVAIAEGRYASAGIVNALPDLVLNTLRQDQ
jgi:hypothetical protein